MATPAQQLAAILTDAIIAALKDREDELTAIAEAGGSKAGGGLFKDVGSLVGIIGDIVGAVPIVGELIDLPLAPLKAVEGAAGESGTSFGLGYMLGQLGWNVAEPAIEPVQHAVAQLLQTGVFDPQTAAGLVSKGIAENDWAASEAAKGNLDAHHFNMLTDAAGNRPSFDVAAEMLRRGLIQQADFATALARNDIPPFWFDAYQGLMRQLLSPADLALAQLRGELQPDFASGYAAMLGLENADFQTLVNNTGEPPGLEMMMEALRRQFVGPDDFTRAVLQSRVRDEWIPTLLKLQLSPMSTADAIRAVVENYLTSDEGAAIAAQNGLEPEHWPILVESWGRPLSHEQMISLYLRGEATLDDVKQAIKESDIKNKYVDQAIALQRRLVPERTVVMMLQHGVIKDTDAFVMLHQQGYSDDDVAAIINLGVAEHVTTHKALTKADILSLYGDSLIQRADAKAKLVALGYSDADAVEELDLADYKAKAVAIRTIKTGVEARVKAHDLQPDAAIIELTNAGLDHDQATALVDQWTLKRQTPTRGLTEAQILKLAKDELLQPGDALNRLVALGLVQADARLLLEAYAGVKV